jgi:hypothetical protein
MLAGPLLDERTTPSRLAAAFAGLVGAYLIVRLGADIKMGSLLAVLSGVLFAGYLVTTRIAASMTPPLDALRFQCVFGALFLAPFAALNWAWPTREEIALIMLREPFPPRVAFSSSQLFVTRRPPSSRRSHILSWQRLPCSDRLSLPSSQTLSQPRGLAWSLEAD